MKNSYKYFCNTDCEYHPCHEGVDDINWLFCFCPCYFLEYCPGSPSYLSNGVKDCSDCIFPHDPYNYDNLMKFISTNITK